MHIVDAKLDPEYTFTRGQRIGQFHTLLGIPLLREGDAIGVIVLARAAVRPFTQKQIELVATFADQAVIAIENVRLFETEQQRTRELRESLQQQTATADVLKVISGSPGELEPVFNTILENATRICEAKFGSMYLYEGDAFRFVAITMHCQHLSSTHARSNRPATSGHSAGRIAATKQVSHIVDIRRCRPSRA